MKIKQVYAREILDSRASPTVEAIIILGNGSFVRASCPSGASVGTYEAKEIKDNDPGRMAGLGVLKAVNNINTEIAPKLIGLDPTKQSKIDKLMTALDGTEDKSRLGANAILPVSIAVAKAGALSLNMHLYAYLRHYTSDMDKPFKIPTPLFNVINGGKHASDNFDFQEFIVIPDSSLSFSKSLEMGVSVYHSIKKMLQEKNEGTLVGDEGGFSPKLSTNRNALLLISNAITNLNLTIGKDIFLGLDTAATNFYKNSAYSVSDKNGQLSSEQLISFYQELNSTYNFLYLEDPLSEDDWQGWEILNKTIDPKTIVTGDDLTTTNYKRLQTAISKKAIRGIIIKPNQIGSVIETIEVFNAAKNADIKTIVSHRSGESNDDFIADFAVGMNSDFVKFGAPARGERVAKYNRLLEIEYQINLSH